MIKFKTESGSIYTLDEENKRWESTSISTRTNGGEMVAHTDVLVGIHVVIFGPGLDFGTRMIRTTKVIEIL